MDLNDICRLALRHHASDIHFKAGRPPMLRIHGQLRPIPKVAPMPAEAIGKMAWELMTDAQRKKFKAKNDLDMGWTGPSLGRFRVNVFRQRGQVGMVFRPIPSEVATIDDLQLPEVLKKVALMSRGLVVVTGATGAGKSTTLAAMIEEVNRKLPHHVMTIEDPIEFNFTDRKSIINQREIGADSTTFASALRAALRQDPDVILVGELRDQETTEIAMKAAETGHMVFTTLHTIDAPETINRLVSFFPPHQHQAVRHQLSSLLQAVVSQRLVPTKAGKRVAIQEIMLNVGAVREAIADHGRVKEIPDLIAKGVKQYGTQTFDQALYRLIKRGVIDQAEALRFSDNPDDLTLRLSGIGAEDWDAALS